MRSFCGLMALLSLAALSACSRNSGTSAAIPHLRKQGTATQLIVDGKPFLMLAGELRNSNSSTPDYLKPMAARSLLAPKPPRLIAVALAPLPADEESP